MLSPSDNHALPCTDSTLRRALLALVLLGVLLVSLVATAPARADVPRTFFSLSTVRPVPGDFARIAQVGAGTVRVEIGWPSVQSSKGAAFDWRETDKRFRQAATFGLAPQPVIFGAPGFVTGDDEHVRGPVKTVSERRRWKRFAAAAMARYGPNGEFWVNSALDQSLAPRNWIVWNEQNARAFWHPKASPAGYATLLEITREAFDSVDPSTKMTIGGMYGYPIHPKAMGAKKFLNKLYKRKGTKKLIDGVSVHPYAGKLRGVKKQVKMLRRVMNKRGDRRASLYIGETGWASSGRETGAFNFLIKSKKGQARLLKKSYKFFLNKRVKWRIRGVSWFTWRDYGNDGGHEVCGWCPKAGLLNQRNQVKPAGEAFASLVARKTG